MGHGEINCGLRLSSRALASFCISFFKMVLPDRSHADDHIAFKHEHYQEEHGRIEIATSAALIEKAITSAIAVKGEIVYDSISGATPTGGPPLAGSREVPIQEIRDIRRAGNFELNGRWGQHTFAPQFSYSIENDYESYGLAYNHGIEFNQKNTTLTLGISHNFDRLLPAHTFLDAVEHKDTTDGMIGISQLLSPTTVLTGNFTMGISEGYLADPYKGVRFDSFPDEDGAFLFPESRPRHKSRQVAYVSLLQYINSMDASVEAAYRFHHDSFGIWSHTGSLAWNQKIGRHLILQPNVRFYDQTEASFYNVRIPAQFGDPQIPLAGFPEFFSADFRLSNFHSWTYGLKATIKIHEHFTLDTAFKRYEMAGNDNITAASVYPKANVFTIGCTVWF